MTELIRPTVPYDDDGSVLRAATLLLRGKLVAFPTETVYGLGADARNPEAVQAIFETKERPADNPLIAHVAALRDVEEIASIEHPETRRLMEHFWPGPLTVILPVPRGHRPAASRGLDTLAVRMPDHPLALALIRRCGFAIAAPSANRSGRPSPTTAQHVYDDLQGRIPLILDGGPCRVGIESTVLDLSTTTARILRPGQVRAEEIAKVLGTEVSTLIETHGAKSPGTRYRHYRPNAPVVLVDPTVSASVMKAAIQMWFEAAGTSTPTGYIGPDDLKELGSAVIVEPVRNADDLMPQLYALLRDLDERSIRIIFARAYDPAHPIMDRLRRASSITLTGAAARHQMRAFLDTRIWK
jgi:L-threonylcarbamoyladenylate synthase